MHVQIRRASSSPGSTDAARRAAPSARPASAGASARNDWFSSSAVRSNTVSISGTAKCLRSMPWLPLRMLCRISIERFFRRERTADSSTIRQQSGWEKVAAGTAVARD